MTARTTTIVADGFAFPEGPRWHEDRLWFSDQHDRRVVAMDTDGKSETIVDVPQQPSGLGWLLDGRMLVVSMRDRRVLIVDDGSADNTRDQVNAMARTMPIDVVRHPINRGLWETIRDGFERVAALADPGDIIIRMDADDTHDPTGAQPRLDDGETQGNRQPVQQAPGRRHTPAGPRGFAVKRVAQIAHALRAGLTGFAKARTESVQRREDAPGRKLLILT